MFGMSMMPNNSRMSDKEGMINNQAIPEKQAMSEKLARQLFAQAQAFDAELAEAGWIEAADSPVDSKSPTDLFNSKERPLVVGLFGGTGVGKSSLLNRLAGAEIARTGVVRPTSMEITAYLHESIQLDALPEHFDAERFSANRHSNAALASVMWVDMPDFDSDETDNKDQVMQWLPHIDLLIYVVTPERYKDAEGWRMMIDNGYRHAWLFALNQWDRAESIQYQDFVRLLEGAGFSMPQVFRTVCVGHHEDDEFNQMVDVIAGLSKHNIVTHLQERGWMQRLERCQNQLQQNARVLTVGEQTSLEESLLHRWQEFENTAIAHLDSSFKGHSELFTADKTNPVGAVLQSLSGKSSTTEIAKNIANRKEAGSLWDEWLTVRHQDTLQQFKLASTEHGVPKEVFEQAALADARSGDSQMQQRLNSAVTSAIKTPGTPQQRLVAKCAKAARIILPLLVLVWVTWRVIHGFVAGAEDRTAYVGFDFFINGLLLAGLGWVVPLVIEKVFVPSVPDSVYRALHTELKKGLGDLEKQMQPQLKEIDSNRRSLASRGRDLDARIDQLLNDVASAPNPVVSRILMNSRE